MPASVPVPLPLSTNVTPFGSVTPPRAIAGTGKPVVATVKDPAAATVKVTLAALVIAGAWFTFSVKACVVFGSTPFDAVKVSAYEPPVPAAGGPLKVPVPLPLSVKVTPAGSDPLTVSVGVGAPVAVTVK